MNSLGAADAEQSDEIRQPGRLKSGLCRVTVLLIGLTTIGTNCADPDLWGHVQYGREVIQEGTLPRTATWTYAAEGAEWINHENIAELLLAFTVDTLGPAALPWMKLVVAAGLFSLMISASRRAGAGWPAIGIMTMVVGTSLQFHWHYRPQILTYLCLAAMLWIWQAALGDSGTEIAENTPRKSLRWLWSLPLLMCFWANSHGGFAAGIAILVTFHIGLVLSICRMRFSESMMNRRETAVHTSVDAPAGSAAETLQTSSRFSLTTCRTLILVTIVSVAATLINPYGIHLWRFMLAALRLPRPEIADWGPLELWGFESIRFWSLILITLISLLFSKRSQNPVQLLIMSLLLWQAVSHCRHLSIFAVLLGFWIPRHLESVLVRSCEALNRTLQERHDTSTRESPWPYASAFCLVIIGLCLFRMRTLTQEIPVDRSEYPVSAMQYMSDEGLNGKVLVTFNWAQYAIGCFASGDAGMKTSRVAVDGRFETCYPREITDICFDFWFGTDDRRVRYRSPTAPQFDVSRALELEAPDLVLISRMQNPSVRVMEQHQDSWTLLYQDSLSQLWGRRSICDDPGNSRYVPLSRRQITDSVQRGNTPWPAFPEHRPQTQYATQEPPVRSASGSVMTDQQTAGEPANQATHLQHRQCGQNS